MAKKQRITVDISEVVAEIDEYPEKAGIDPDVWNALTYPQKCLLLVKKGLAAVNDNLEDIED